MVNAITPQYSQYQQYQQPQQPAAQPQAAQYQPVAAVQQPAMQAPLQYRPQTIPVGPNASAVNIQIYGPTAYGTGASASTAAQPYPPQPYPYYPHPSQYQGYPYGIHSGNINGNGNVNGSGNIVGDGSGNASANVNTNTNTNITTNTSDTDGTKKNEKIVALTDEYIKSLENYLNNQDPKIRMQAINEILKRFKEDKSRMNDVALTALLNKALQDPSASVRFMALTILDVGYASGNEETLNILKQVEHQSGSTIQAEDARLASQILLKSSGNTVEVPAGTGHAPPKEEKPKAEK